MGVKALAAALQHLWQADAILHQRVEVYADLVSLRFAAPAGDVNDARNRFEAALKDPVLDRL